jgi:transposase-like protein
MPESTLTVNRWTPTRKGAVALELLRGADVVELARKHGLSQAQLFAWRDRFLEAGRAALRTRQGRAAQEQDRQVRELERKVGQLTLENELLKKTDELIRQRGRRLIR